MDFFTRPKSSATKIYHLIYYLIRADQIPNSQTPAANAVTPGKRRCPNIRHTTPIIPAANRAAMPANGHSPYRPIHIFQSAPPIQPFQAAIVQIETTKSWKAETSQLPLNQAWAARASTPSTKNGMLIQFETSA